MYRRWEAAGSGVSCVAHIPAESSYFFDRNVAPMTPEALAGLQAFLPEPSSSPVA